jgi:stringent starvation protein B
VLAIYAQENGQGMMFPAESIESAPTDPQPAKPTEPSPPDDPPPRKGPVLRVVK